MKSRIAMRVPRSILSALRKDDTFLVAVHIDPDGDAIGSALALLSALEALGKKAFVYSRDPIPKYYRFLPGHEKFSSSLNDLVREDPVLVLVDCNTPARAAVEGHSFRKSIVIDHHETEKDFGDVRWVDHTAAATGVMIFFLLKALRIACTRNMALNLYTAISVDTGTFRYSNTSADVLRVSAELVEAGADPNNIAVNLYESWDYRRFKLLVLALNTLEVKDRTAMVHVTQKMFKDTRTNSEDTEHFSNFPRMIGSIKMAVLLRELKGGAWKASLRSRGDVNVARIAEQYGGGGHQNAAGFKMKADLKTVKKNLFAAARKFSK
jgi:phosphoesterase RecJ-like protein